MREAIELVAVVRDELAGEDVLALDDAAHLLVDLARGVFRVVLAARRDLAAEEHAFLVLAVGDRAELLAHAELAHHGAGEARGALDVVLSAGRDLAEHDLLGDAAAERHRDAGERLLLRS